MMVLEKNLYTRLGELLRYPKEDIRPMVDECLHILTEGQYLDEIINELKNFRRDLDNLSLDKLQELYSYTFELVSDTTLDMGYYIHDGFKRSRNLLTIKSMYRELGFPFEEIARGELPDNLSVTLQFIGFIKDEELRKDFTKSFVIQAMEKLNRNFQTKKNAYRHLVNTVYRILDKDVKETK
jgi:nitrate reductase molybdenum cofactor assembly chaperone